MDVDHLQPGSVIAGRYQVLEEIGEGGMGTVYRVKDTLLGDKEIALKTLLSEFSREKAYVERFIREIELMNLVNHPNVVRTYDIGTDGNLIYFTMEFVRGISLDELIDRGPLPLKDVPRLLIQLCRGLHSIHKADIIHRDLKPGNIILLKDGTLKITDFGVARPKTSALTKKNERVGSIWYMAPETWQGGTLTKATDLYSLGVLIFEVITGRLPFDSDEPAELMQMHLKKTPPPVRHYRKEVPQWLERVTMRLLAKAPKERPKSAKDVIELVTLNTSGSHPTLSSGTRDQVPSDSGRKSAMKQALQPRPAKQYRERSGRRRSTQQARAQRRNNQLPWEATPFTTLLLILILFVLMLLIAIQLSR